MRRIKNYKNMSKEELLISLLKSKQSIAELPKSKSNSAEIEEIEKNFNALRNNFSKEKIKEIRKNFMREKKQTNILKNQKKKRRSLKTEAKKYQEKQEKKHYTEKLKKVEEFLKKLEEEDFNRLKKHHYCGNDYPDYKGVRYIENLFNEINQDYYKSVKIKSAFNDNYI